MQQHVVQGLGTQLGRLDKDAQVVHHLVLSAEVAELEGAEGVLEVALFAGGLIVSYVKLFFHVLS